MSCDDACATARLRALLRRIYPFVDDVPGTEALQAELEREVVGGAMTARAAALTAWSLGTGGRQDARVPAPPARPAHRSRA